MLRRALEAGQDPLGLESNQSAMRSTLAPRVLWNFRSIKA